MQFLTLLYRGSKSLVSMGTDELIELSYYGGVRKERFDCKLLYIQNQTSFNFTSSKCLSSCCSRIVSIPSSSSNTEMGSKLSSAKDKITMHPKRSQRMA